MKRSNAIRHLVEMGETATEMLRFRGTEPGWQLEQMWVTGELLETPGEIEWGCVILLLDVEAAELPWMARHPEGEWTGDRLGTTNRPLSWRYRPVSLPPWTAIHRRVARFWDAENGLDEETIAALRAGADPAIVEPTDDQLREQLASELEVSKAHLRHIVDNYWESDWRRNLRGGKPQEHLWRANTGLFEIEDALAELEEKF